MVGGLVVVWAHRAPAGFSDGGDSVAGDGLIAVLAQPSPDGFSDGGDGPMAVLAQLPVRFLGRRGRPRPGAGAGATRPGRLF